MVKINDNIEIDEEMLVHLKNLAFHYDLNCDKPEDLELLYNIHNITTIENLFKYNPMNGTQYITDYMQKVSDFMSTSQFKNIKEVTTKWYFERKVLGLIERLCIKYFDTKTDFTYR